MTPPTLQSLRDAVLDGSTADRVYVIAVNWTDAGCPTLAPETTALLAHLCNGDTESDGFYAALRAWKGVGCPGVPAPVKGVGDAR